MHETFQTLEILAVGYLCDDGSSPSRLSCCSYIEKLFHYHVLSIALNSFLVTCNELSHCVTTKAIFPLQFSVSLNTF